MSDGLSDYWADKFRRVSPRSEPPEISEVRAAKPVAEPWTRGEYHRPIVPRHPEPESVKEIYWRLRAERLERELDAKRPYFWLGRDAE